MDEQQAQDAAAKARMMQLILGGAFSMGVVMLCVVGAVVGTGQPNAPAGTTPQPVQVPGLLGLDPQHELLFLIAGGMALTAVPFSFVMRGMLTKAVDRAEQAGDDGTGARMTGFLLGAAFCEGPALFGGVLILLSGQLMPPVLVAGLGLFGIIAHTAMPVVKTERDPNLTRYNVGS